MTKVLVNVATLAELQRKIDFLDVFPDQHRVVDAVHHKLDDLMLQPKLATVCAWCPDSKELTQRLLLEGKAVSHGICAACAEKVAS